MNDPIQQNLARPQRYWYVDGLAEIAGGCVILLLGLIYTAAAIITDKAVHVILLSIVQPVLILSSAWVTRVAVRRLKEKITYPRTGYVEYSRNGRSVLLSRFALAFFIGFAFSAIAGLIGKRIPERFEPLIISFLLSLAVLYLGARIGLRRFYLVAGATLASGAVTLLFNLAGEWPFALVFSAEGLFWIISGVVVLMNYLRSTRPLAQEDNDA